MNEARVVNAANLVGVHAAYLAGIRALPALAADPVFGGFVRHVVFAEVLPSIAAPERAKRAHAEQVLASLHDIGKPAVSITAYPVSQWCVGVLPSLVDYHRSRGMVPPALAMSFAALVAFCRGRAIRAGELEAHDGSQPYLILERPQTVAFFSEAWANLEMNGDWYSLAYATLAETDLWGEDLNRIRGFVGTVAQDLAMIAISGTRAAVASLNVPPP